MQEARKWEINWISCPFRQIVAVWLNSDGFFFLYLLAKIPVIEYNGMKQNDENNLGKQEQYV